MLNGCGRAKCLLAAVLVLLCTAAAARADFADWDWMLATCVIDFSTSPSQSDGYFGYSVVNPFHAEHFGTIGASSASGKYDFTGEGEAASFSIQAENRAEYTAGDVIATSQGSVLFTPSVDLLVSVDGAYSYELPGYGMGAEFVVGFGTSDPEWEWVFAQGGNVDSWLEFPLSGTIDIHGQEVLPANTPCFLRYSMRVDASGGGGAAATGSGYVNIEIQPLPEPSTLGLLAMGGFVVFRRRRA